MCSASVQVIFESGETLDQDIEYFTHRHNASSTRTLPHIDMSVVPIVAMVLTIGMSSSFIIAEDYTIFFSLVSQCQNQFYSSCVIELKTQPCMLLLKTVGMMSHQI